MKKPKRKTRGVEKTKLVMCEGITDKRFVERIKHLFVSRENGFSIKIDEAGGGGPKSAIITAINHVGSFDKRYVFIDSDIPVPKDALSAAINHKMTIIQSEPLCLEGFLLRYMGHRNGVISAQEAKDLFHNYYNLDGVVTQDWFEQHVTLSSTSSIISNRSHCCQSILKDLVDMLTIF